MRKHIGFVIYALLISLCSGCGHSVLLTSKMTGFHLAVPLGEGQ